MQHGPFVYTLRGFFYYILPCIVEQIHISQLLMVYVYLNPISWNVYLFSRDSFLLLFFIKAFIVHFRAIQISLRGKDNSD